MLQDELQYEDCVRGISVSDVQLLRNIFKSMVSEGVPVDLDNLLQLCIEDLYSRVASKIVGLQALVKKSSLNLPLLVPRFRTNGWFGTLYLIIFKSLRSKPQW